MLVVERLWCYAVQGSDYGVTWEVQYRVIELGGNSDHVGMCFCARVCGNPHGIIRKYGLMCCRQCFRSNAKEIGFIKRDPNRLVLSLYRIPSQPAGKDSAAAAVFFPVTLSPPRRRRIRSSHGFEFRVSFFLRSIVIYIETLEVI
ncbi:hypothetical protein Droror1_Dr00006869 [Drosera rotundifolia]